MTFGIPSSIKSLDNIKNYIVKTPLKFSERLSEETNSNIFLKLENIQKTGSFKARGALNKILLPQPPASKRQILNLPFSLNRDAITAPAEPPPTITKSACFIIFIQAFSLSLIKD